MAENKTRQTDASVESYLEAIEDPVRRQDCRALTKLMTKVTGHEPRMWGTGIVGFGSYHYKYASGREGDAALTGFSSRKGDISVYLVASSARQPELLQKLGRHKMGKSCLYIRKLADLDASVMELLVVESVAEVRRRYG
ncbi:MAG: DUF1801 domain-containing protein [Betaproteobacteria bacterium]